MKNLYLYDYIGAEGCDLPAIQQAIDAAGDEQDFRLYINSPGGSVYTAIGIYNLLKSKNVEVVITGQAASAAGYIAMAGKNRKIYSNSTFLIHSISTMAIGNEKEMRKVAENMETLKGLVAGNYAAASGRTVEDVLADMEAGDGGEVLTAQKALERGYVTEVIEPGQAEKADVMIDYLMTIGQIKTAPRGHKPEGDEEMKLSKASLLALGLDETATEEQVNAAIAAKTQTAAAPDVSALETRIAQMEAQAQTAKNESLVMEAIALGKITPAEKAAYLAFAKADYAGCKASIDAKQSATPGSVSVQKKTVDAEKMSFKEQAAALIHNEMAMKGLLK